VLKWIATAAAVTVIAFPLALLFLAGAAASPGAGGASVQALNTIPPAYLTLYLDAARTCPGLPWSVLAGIGEVESDHGQSTARGVRSGAKVGQRPPALHNKPSPARGNAPSARRQLR
jgi:hypothetical protein